MTGVVPRPENLPNPSTCVGELQGLGEYGTSEVRVEGYVVYRSLSLIKEETVSLRESRSRFSPLPQAPLP